MAFLIQNTRTGDFIDGRDDTEWTMIRDYAKRFPTKLDAERWIAKNGYDDYPPIYKIVTESTAVKNINHYIAEAVEKKLTEGVMTFKVTPTKNSYGDTVYYVSQIKLDDGTVWNQYPRLLFGPDNKYEEKSSVKRAIDRYMEGRGEYKIIGI